MAIGWMTSIFAVILLITKESRVMTYPWRKFGLYTVDACPGNQTEWEEASRRLNCTMKPKVFENRYHCVATRDLTRLVEFCYPYTRSIFEKGQCVILDPPFTLNNYTCLHFTYGCPDTHHYTDQLYKYPNCIRIEPALKCFIADKLCLKKNRGTTMRNEELSTVQTFIPQNTTTQEMVSVSITTHVQKENLVPVLIPTLILLGILFGIVIFGMIWWKRKQCTGFFERNGLEDLEKGQHEPDSVSNNTSKNPCEEQVENKREDEDLSIEQHVTSRNIRQQRNQEHGSGEEEIPLLSGTLDQHKTEISKSDSLNNTITRKPFEEQVEGRREGEELSVEQDVQSCYSRLQRNQHHGNGGMKKAPLSELSDAMVNTTAEKYRHDHFKDCKEQKSKKHDIQHLEGKNDFGTDLEKMIDTTRKMLVQFEKEFRDLYVTTRASEKVMKVLEKKRCVFIKGNPGDGKTTLAKYILVELEKRGMKPMQILSLANFYGKVPGCSRLVIFLDNMFGERSVLKNEVHYFDIQTDLIKATLLDDEKGNGNMFIATLRNDIHRECENTMQNIEFFNNSIVDISDTENRINRKEFESFVSKYALQDTIVSVDEILMTRNLGFTIGIPQCIKILKKIAQNKANIHDIFEDPLKHLQKEIKLRIKDKEHKTAVLIYILLCGGSVKDEILKSYAMDKERKGKALKIIGLEENVSSMTEFHDSIRFYEGSYIEHDDIDDEYRFTHSSVQGSLFLYTFQHYPKDILSACDPSLLITLSTTVSPNTIFIDTDLFPDLIDRLKIILEGGEVSDFRSISLMRLWSDDEFSKEVRQNEECRQSMVKSVDKRDDSMLVHFSGAGNINWVKHLSSGSTNEQRYKSLNKACSYNHIDVVDFFLEENVNRDLKTCFYAVQSGNIEMLFRLTNKIDLTQTTFSNDTTWSFLRGGLLHEICYFGQNQMIDPVLERYPSLLDVRNEQGGNALHFVAYAGQKNTFTMLINRGSDPYSRTNHGSTVLHYACQNGKINMVKYICETYPELWTKRFDDYEGHSPLHWASESGKIELYEYLLKKGVTADLANNGKSVLHISCMKGHLEMCKYLVKTDPKLLDVSDNLGRTVLHDAAWGGNIDVFKFLTDKGLDVKSTRNDGKTVLRYCCANGKLEMCKYLVKYYPDLLNVIHHDGYTVLHDAARGGNLDLFSYLVTVGKNVNDLTNDGKSVLHISCLSGHLAMCKYLVNNNPVLLNVIDHDGYTVLHDAARGGNLDLFSYLLTVGKNVHDLTNTGESFLYSLFGGEGNEICQYLVKNHPNLLDGETILHVAARTRGLQMCKVLVSKYPYLLDIKNYDNENALPDAAWGGNIDVFKFLIDKGLGVGSTSRHGKSMLHWSCRSGKKEISRYLVLNYPYLLGSIDNDGMTVLHDAAWGGNIELFEFLIDKGLDVSSTTNNGKTVVHLCCRNGKTTMFNYLIKKYPNFLYLMNFDDENVLHDAAWGGNVDLFKLVMGKGFNVNSKSKKGKTVLHHCCMNGKIEICKYLIYNYPGLSAISDSDGETVLHDAAWGGNVDLLRFLIDKELDVNSTTNKGKTVLHKCCMNGKVQMCKYLANLNPDLIEIIDNDEETVLHDAAWGGNICLLEFLIDKGLDVNEKTNKGKTVLHKCCMNGKVQMCKYLINHHPHLLTVKDIDGVNALHDAAWGGDVELFKFLLEKGLDGNSMLNNGQTVLHRCCHEGKKKMFDYLMESQPDLLFVVDNDGNTVLHIACVQNQTNMCCSLVDRFPDILDIENRIGERVVEYSVGGVRQFKKTS